MLESVKAAKQQSLTQVPQQAGAPKRTAGSAPDPERERMSLVARTCAVEQRLTHLMGRVEWAAKSAGTRGDTSVVDDAQAAHRRLTGLRDKKVKPLIALRNTETPTKRQLVNWSANIGIAEGALANESAPVNNLARISDTAIKSGNEERSEHESTARLVGKIAELPVDLAAAASGPVGVAAWAAAKSIGHQDMDGEVSAVQVAADVGLGMAAGKLGGMAAGKMGGAAAAKMGIVPPLGKLGDVGRPLAEQAAMWCLKKGTGTAARKGLKTTTGR
ncbi:MAG: hypothetical protein ACI9WU_003169 [Myxococcota bacterium]|jgi:hypothetical protein